MWTYHAVYQVRNWTRYEQPDAANTEGTLIPAAHPAAPPAEAQADGAAAARGRQTCARAAGRGAATDVHGAGIPRAKPGDVAFMHWSSACEVLTRGELTRLLAATSAALATCNQTI